MKSGVVLRITVYLTGGMMGLVAGVMIVSRCRAKKIDDEEKQENRDAARLTLWKRALNGIHGLCSDAVRDLLDSQLLGWRNDLDENSIQEARAIVERAKERVVAGGAPLPCRHDNPKNEVDKKEGKDACQTRKAYP